MNEPSFELGNAAAEAALAPEALAELCRAYYGRVDEALVARAELWGFMARYGWTLWGSIQDGHEPDRLRLPGMVAGEARARRAARAEPALRRPPRPASGR